jgi:hypothetical protein
MSKVVTMLTLALLAALSAVPAAGESAVPDLRGTWKGNSESVVSGGANQHHATRSTSRMAGGSPARSCRPAATTKWSP